MVGEWQAVVIAITDKGIGLHRTLQFALIANVRRIGYMTGFIVSAKTFLKSEDAPTMVEYGLLVGLIAMVVAIGAAVLGQGISSLFNTTANSV